MNKYSKLSDYEINKRVAEGLDYPHESEVAGSNGIRLSDSFLSTHFDPCNSWADGGPIIEGSNISLLTENGNTTAYVGVDCIYMDGYVEFSYKLEAESSKPLRSAMEVFLIMEDAKNDK